MRCSSSERLLARYLDDALTPRGKADIAMHLHGCPHCSGMLAELKNLDALLLTTHLPDLPGDFTHAVMRHTKAMPAPRARRFSLMLAAGLYVAAAWIALLVWFTVGRANAIADVTGAPQPFAPIWNAMLAVLGSGEHAFGPAGAMLALTLVVVLALDVLALAGILYFYRSIRPHLVTVVSKGSHR